MSTPDEALATALQYPVLRLAGYLDTTPEEFTTKLSAALAASGYAIVPSELAGLRAALEAACDAWTEEHGPAGYAAHPPAWFRQARAVLEGVSR